VHRRRGGKGVAQHAADYKTAHDGKSLAVKSNSARDTAVTGILHGRSPPSKGSTSSKGSSSSVPFDTVSPQQAAQAFTNLYNKQTAVIAGTASGVGTVIGTVGGRAAYKAWKDEVEAAARSDDLKTIASEGEFTTKIAKQPLRTVYKVGGKYFRTKAQATDYDRTHFKPLADETPEMKSVEVGGDMEIRLSFVRPRFEDGKEIAEGFASEPIKLRYDAVTKSYVVENPGELRSALTDLQTLRDSLKQAGMVANPKLATSIRVLRNLDTEGTLTFKSVFQNVEHGETEAEELTTKVKNFERYSDETADPEGYSSAEDAADVSSDPESWDSVALGMLGL
jgi:hypothetical protein